MYGDVGFLPHTRTRTKFKEQSQIVKSQKQIKAPSVFYRSDKVEVGSIDEKVNIDFRNYLFGWINNIEIIIINGYNFK